MPTGEPGCGTASPCRKIAGVACTALAVRKIVGRAREENSRRVGGTRLSRLLKIVAALVGLTLAGAIGLAYGVKIEPRSLRLRQFLIGLPGLPAELDGIKIGFLTDFHVSGPGFGTELTAEAIEIMRQQQPDLLLLGGDYFDAARWSDDGSVFDRLAGFRNVFGIFGNHDHRRGEPGVTHIGDMLERRGVRVLRNSSASARIGGLDVRVAGVDDPYTGHDDLCAALRNAEQPLVLLAHAPALRDLPPGTASLVLCGHTHAGQIRLSPAAKLTPLDSTWWLDRVLERPRSRFQRGFHWVNGNLLYVGNGIGTTRLPLRIFAPPEAVLFHLSKTEPHQDQPCDSARRYVEDIG